MLKIMDPQFQYDFTHKVILAVEDEDSNYALLEALLVPAGATLLRASTGKIAMELLTSTPKIDLILMDIKLPDTSGYEVTKQVRKVYPELPVIAQTAFVMTGDREKALDAGCNAYISKPIDLIELMDIISGYIC